MGVGGNLFQPNRTRMETVTKPDEVSKKIQESREAEQARG